MTIDEAVISLQARPGEPDIFQVRHNGTTIIVDVQLIYRVKEVTDLGPNWEGFPLSTGRKSCW